MPRLVLRAKFSAGQEVWFTLPGRGPRHGTIERARRDRTYTISATTSGAVVLAVPEAWIRPDRQEELPLTV